MTCPCLNMISVSVFCLIIVSVVAKPQQQCTNPLPFPHPTDCQKYYVCAPWGVQTMDCAPGTEFNSQLHVCDWPWRAGCHVTTVTEPPTTQEPFTEPATSTTEDEGSGDDGSGDEGSGDIVTLFPEESQEDSDPEHKEADDDKSKGHDEPPHHDDSGSQETKEKDESVEHSDKKEPRKVDPNDVCKDAPKGMSVRPYPNDPTKFILCTDGTGMIMDCPKNQTFNKALNACSENA